MSLIWHAPPRFSQPTGVRNYILNTACGQGLKIIFFTWSRAVKFALTILIFESIQYSMPFLRSLLYYMHLFLVNPILLAPLILFIFWTAAQIRTLWQGLSTVPYFNRSLLIQTLINIKQHIAFGLHGFAHNSNAKLITAGGLMCRIIHDGRKP